MMLGSVTRVSRWLAIVVALVVAAGLLVVLPSSSIAVAAASGDIPAQEWGSAAGRSHEAPADATREPGSGGHNAEPAPGLPADERFRSPGLIEGSVGRTTAQVGVAPAEPPVRGFDPATSQEDVSKRSGDRQVFRNADGTMTMRKYQNRTFFQKPDGSWDKIDTTLVPDGADLRTRADSNAKRFATRANDPELVSVDLGAGRSVAYGLALATSAGAQVEGESATYPNVRPNSDLLLEAIPSGAKETIVLKSKDAPTTWDFPLQLSGLTASLDANGAVLLTDAAGVVEAIIPPGFMEDSAINPLSGEGARSTGVTYALIGDPAQPVLRVSVDAAWLNDPARVFPVKVDPTVVKNSNGTTYVQSPYNADYSGDPNLSVGTYNGGANKAAAYLKFDSVSSELAGNYVLGAKLWMFETYAYSCQARPVTIHPVTAGWSVGGAKTYPGPAFGAEIANASFAHGYDPGTCGSSWVGIDLGNAGRDLVHGWTHGAPNNGLTVRASETDTFGWKKFASAATVNAPYLEVTFTAYWATYNVGAMDPVVTSSTDGAMSVTVTNGGRDVWSPNNNYALGYRLWDANGNELPAEQTAWTKMPHDVAPGQSVTLNAKIKSLPPGAYTLRWDMDNVGFGRFSWENVPMSAPVNFQIVNQTPVIDSMSPPSNYNSTTLNPTLAMTGHDRDVYPGQGINYHFKICEVGNDTNCKDSGWIDSPVWSVPANWMTWSKNYVWQGQIGDHQTESPWSAGSYLSTRVPQPAITSHLSSVNGGGVDPGVANFTTPVTDAAVAAVGPELSVVRTYNSLDPRKSGAFGEGWATRWDTRLVPDTDGSGNVVLTWTDGRQSRFGKNPDGSYAAPSGQFATLLAVTGGGWTLRTKDGTRYAFDAGGKLTTITDAAGRTQALAYDGAGKLASATDTTSGRSLSFTWTGNHVTTVTTHPDPQLSWTYSYDGDRLTRVCDPTQACTSYASTTGSHYRTVTMDANPRGYWRLAETTGTTAVSDQPGFSGTADATATNVTWGQAGPLAGSPTTAAGFNGTSSVVRLPDNLVRNSHYIGIELWFKTTSPGVLFSTSNDQPGTANPGGAMPVLYVGTDGKLYGHLWNGSVNGIVTPAAVNNGAWHHVVLSGAYNTQTLYLDGAAVGTMAGQLANIDPYNFVGVGAVSTRAWPAKPAGTWNYFTGTIAEVALYHQPLGATTVAEHYAARAASNQLTTITRPGGSVAANLVYNAAADRVAQYTDTNGGTTSYTLPAVEGDGFRYATSVVDSDPHANWRLGETSGTTVGGDPTLSQATYVRGSGGGTTPGPFTGSQSQWLDGTSSYIRLPDQSVTGTNQISVELLFRTTTTAGGVLFSTGNDAPGAANPGGAMPVLYVGTDGKLYGHFWNSSTTGIVTPGKVNTGAWQHVVLTGDHNTQTLYLNGNPVGTLSGEIKNIDPYAFVGAGAVNTMTWPARPTNNWGYLPGAVSNVALYSRSLPASEVSAHYSATTSKTSYLNAVRATGPTTLWGLEDANNSPIAVNDPATVTGSATATTPTSSPVMRGSTGFAFNGTSSYVRLPDRQARGRTRLAIEMWFQTTSPGVLYSTSANALPGVANPSGTMPVLYVGTDGKLYGHFWNGNVNGITTSAAVNDGKWHHVVLSGDVDTQRLYLDGNLAGTTTGAIDNLDRYELIGAGAVNGQNWPAKPAGTWSYFTGSIGEVAFYHRPLDSASVSTHYSAKVAAYQIQATDPAAKVTTYTYDPTRGGRLVTTTTPTGGTKVWGYDTGGFVNRTIDENGHTTRFANDARGNTLSRTVCRAAGPSDCYSSYRSYYLNTADPLDPRNDRVTEDRDARSDSATDNRYLTSYTYTPTGAVATVTQPPTNDGATRITSTVYTDGTEAAVGGGTQPPGLVEKVTNPKGGTSTYSYRANGDLAQVADSTGLVTSYGYDGIGRKTLQQIGATGQTGTDDTTYTYDGNSRLTVQTEPVTTNAVTGVTHQRRTTSVYNPNGTLASVTVDDVTGHDPARTTSYTYDNHARVETVTDPAGGVTTTNYDAFGAVIRAVDPVGVEFTATYTDARHQLATRTVKGFTGDGGAARDVVLESRAYDPAGRLASTTDAMGRTRAYTYYDDDLQATETLLGYTDPATNQTRDVQLARYTYTGAGQVAVATKAEGRYSTTTDYDRAGLVVGTTDRDGTTVLRSSALALDALGNPTREIHRNADGSTVADITHGYDTFGRETGRAVATSPTQALTTWITLDPRGNITSTVDPRGTVSGGNPAAYTTSTTYDAYNRPVTTTTPAVPVETNGQPASTVAPVSTTGYNAFGEVVDVRDPNGNVTHTDYDLAGRATATTLPPYTPPGATEPIIATQSIGYDLAGRVTSTTDGRGNTTTYGYDELGNQRRKTDPPALYGQAGGTWIATFDPLGEQLMVSDPTGAQTFATYDKLGNQITSTVVERQPSPTRNLTTRFTYDTLGSPTSVTTPSGVTTKATWDDLGNQLTAVSGAGKTTTSTYNGAGRITSVTNPLGEKTTTSYDWAGRLTSTADLDSAGTVLRTHGFGYDNAGNQTSSTDALGKTTTQTFDAGNRLTSVTRPVSATESITASYGYDAAGNITRATDGNNHTTVFTVTPWNLAESTIEPATAQQPNVADRTYTASYDRNGQIASLAKPGGVVITNSYDALGNITKQTGTGATVATPDRTFTYTARGDLRTVSAPGGTNTYTYDDRGNLISATGPSGDSSATYNDDNRLATATSTAGLTSYGYDTAGRLATAADPLTGAIASYGYDNDDQLTSIGYGTGNATRGFTYDPLGRLTSDTVKAPGGAVTASVSYGYDLEDHLTSKTTTGTAGAAANTYGYDDAGRLTSWTTGGTTTDYGWDGAGNLTRDGPDTATYNERNQLQTKGNTSYTYTARGTLNTRTNGGVTTELTFNAYDELTTDGTTTNTYDALNRLTTTGTTTLSYAGTGQSITNDGTTSYTYTPSGDLLGTKQGAAASLALTDLHTDLTALINPATGAVSGSRAYSPFGKVTNTGGTQTALGYQHQYTDPTSGNTNMGARWYDPTTGGFTSRDTAGLDPRDQNNANRYTYAANNPLTNTDPTGHGVCDLPWGWTGWAEAGQFIICNMILAPRDIIAGECESTLKRSDGSWCPGRGPRNGAYFSYTSTSRPQPIYSPSNRGKKNTPYSKTTSKGGKKKPIGGTPGKPGLSRDQVRQKRVDDDARRPHPRPPTSPTISDYIQDLIDDALNDPGIDLGPLDPNSVNGGDDPYQPDAIAPEINAPQGGMRIVNGDEDDLTTVYRVEGPGNARLDIGPDGSVEIKGNQMLFLNFGDERRAREFLRKRQRQGFMDTEIKTFKVPTSYVDRLRSEAVPEGMRRQFPLNPLVVDINQGFDQFGLRPRHFDDLRANIVPGSGGYYDVN
ncbi:LamG-like jellyroll fold domain-containing protein [Amycolatopsis thermoflava]|uniref:LamG-like jellyroll fold domain-containing protein n=1 Tax=Amycolatopsis thermoflava TaxID=84480 RepID=UPI000403BFF6|nr:LamG-like jellyroll fold domain-containing protein [Amycolatopsis thermoflava]